jgi:hypothetical protein
MAKHASNIITNYGHQNFGSLFGQPEDREEKLNIFVSIGHDHGYLFT